MTTGKRRIPINDKESGWDNPGSSTLPDDQAGAANDDPAGDPGSAGKTGGMVDGGVGSSGGTGGPGAGSETAAPHDIVRERDNAVESLLRLRAEFDNFRRRAARELVEARDRSQGELLGDLLPVLDNLERALDAAEHHDEGKVLGGVRMTRDMFVNLLRRIGVEEIEAVGSAFDPVVHDAVVMQPSNQPEGTVSAVLERGYRLGDRVLRPARVAVSSGPAPNGETGADI